MSMTAWRSRTHLQAAIPLACALAAVPARAQTAAQDGQWSDLFPLPLIAIHGNLLPTGQVLLFSAEHGVPGIHAWVIDPQTLALTNVPPPAGWNLDCAGQSFLPDGRLLVAGGTLQFNPLLGSKRAALFDPYSLQWIPIEDMADGRWYPTNVTLPDGRIVTMSGVNGTTGALNPDIERWDPNGSANWELIGQRPMPDYPNLHVMPSGLVFRSGPDAQTETFNPVTLAWTPVATTNFPARYEAPSILLPPTLNRVMLMGGYVETSGTPTNSVETIDLAAPTPVWTIGPHMQTRRIQHNAVLLPDAKVLVVGGTGVPSVSRMVRVLTRFGDFNQDNDVDPADRDSFETCFTGPGAEPADRNCEPGDFDADMDIDCEDWSRFVVAWTAAGRPAPLPACQSTGAGSRAREGALMLRPPWPNPARDVIGFHYSLPSASTVRLAVYDITGRRSPGQWTPGGR